MTVKETLGDFHGKQLMTGVIPENSERQTDRQTCLTEMKVREAKKEQRKQGCGEEGEVPRVMNPELGRTE